MRSLLLLCWLVAHPCVDAFVPTLRSSLQRSRGVHLARHPRGQLLRTETARLCEPKVQPAAAVPEPSPAETAAAREPSLAATTLTDAAVAAALFVLLQTIGLSFAQLAGFDASQVGGPAACARCAATGLFVLAQQLAGMPAAEYVRGPSAAPSPAALGSLLAPAVAAGAIFALALAATLAAGGELPGATDITAGRLADVLVAAPLTEELFFRGYLLTALRNAGAPSAVAVVASAASFALWHLGIGDAGGPAFFLALGGALALLYERGGRSLPLAAGTHAGYNLLVTLLRAR